MRSMTCWICSSVAPSCITMTMTGPRFLRRFGDCAAGRFEIAVERGRRTDALQTNLRCSEPVRSLRVLPVRGWITVHCETFGGTSLVNDSLKQTANRGIGERPAVICFRVRQNFRFTGRLIKRNVRLLLQMTDLKGTPAAFVQQLHEFLVDLVHAAPPIGDVHGSASRRERPWRAASLKECMRSRSALAAASGVDAFSISDTSAEPMTAASARPPRTETWPGNEIPKPTAIGRSVKRWTRRSKAGSSSERDSFAPVTPLREMR